METISFDGIFCDDIREEKSGKFTLVGVYTGEVILSPDVDYIEFYAWVKIKGLQSGKHEFEIEALKIVSGIESRLGKGKIAVELKADGAHVSFPVPAIGMEVSEDCTLCLRSFRDGVEIGDVSQINIIVTK